MVYTGEKRNEHRDLARKLEKRPPDGKPMHRGEVLEWTMRIISQIRVNVQFLCAFDAKTAHQLDFVLNNRIYE
jgi:hypothetical protein